MHINCIFDSRCCKEHEINLTDAPSLSEQQPVSIQDNGCPILVISIFTSYLILSISTPTMMISQKECFSRLPSVYSFIIHKAEVPFPEIYGNKEKMW